MPWCAAPSIVKGARATTWSLSLAWLGWLQQAVEAAAQATEHQARQLLATCTGSHVPGEGPISQDVGQTPFPSTFPCPHQF